MSDLIIKGEHIYFEGEFKALSLVIRNGKINQIANINFENQNAKVIDAKDCWAMPGIVDTHAHINEPGRTEWEGFETATKAAASGGITTVIDMPLNSIPATTSLLSLNLKRKSAANACAIDYAFWGGAVPGNTHEFIPMIKNNIMGFKSFLCPSGVPEFEYMKEADLKNAMQVLKKYNMPLIAHAEIESHIESKLPDNLYQSYLENRPEVFELDAIKLLIKLCQETKCKTHIVHLSSAKALPLIANAKNKGLPLTVETCPHYLFFNAEEIEKGATHFKCAPPIRNRSNQEGLWQGIKDGIIDFIVSDHSPCTPDLKLKESGNFNKAWGGIAGLQFSLSAIWTEMEKRDLSLVDLVRLMSKNTAQFVGIDNKKGDIKIGADADLIFFNKDKEFEVTEKIIHHRHKLTPYLGYALKGQVEKTFLRGNLIFNNGTFIDQKLGQEVEKN